MLLSMNGNGLVTGNFTTEPKTKNVGVYVHDRMTGSQFKTEQEKKSYEAKLMNKVRKGEKLSVQELNYIRTNMPDLYPVVLRQQNLRESVIKACEKCDSKEEVQKTISNFMDSIPEKDPNRELMLSAIQNAAEEFKKSGTYKSLPEVKPDEDKKKKVAGQKTESDKKSSENQTDSDEDEGKGKVISYVTSDNGYQGAYMEENTEKKEYQA